MKIQQLSLFLENKPGHLSAICRTLASHQINISTLSLADTQQFGILRMIVREWDKARKVLEEKGFVVNLTEVVATEVEDQPGGMARVLEIIEKSATNIEYMYAFTFRKGNRAILVFRFDNPDAAIKTLTANGINVLDPVELYARETDTRA
ncbi:MAG: amino acid-binding protein [Lentisphaerae bacterium RIFOXYC12_FULL_60_16]|nr:MAG: amino acid-binding protein [Lentisphaerae bacterium RIFOXYC12_FULL_60_16]OGV71826.1 MAG: amino acid-binding protein [Lentisphaerae bacterium RIFOXYA12_FULL_60_10]OGV83722.1 MAG: amino acid-binding protein [Lentisphaerae bacterium RIFOXYB12_FULL_60_10]